MLNASSVMRNCLKPSEAAQTTCSSLIKTPIVCVRQAENRPHSKKVKFSEREKHLFTYSETSLHSAESFNVFSQPKFVEVSLCVRTLLNIKLPRYAEHNEDEFACIYCSSLTNIKVSNRALSNSSSLFYVPKLWLESCFHCGILAFESYLWTH